MPSAAFASFAHRDFRLFWFGGFVANSARFSQIVATPVVMWELTASAAWVGLAGFALYLPMALIAPVAGQLADRYQRRRLLMLSQSLMGLMALTMAFTWWSGVRSPSVYILLATLSGFASGLNLPSWQAFVSELVPRELLLNAVTLNSAQFNSSRVIGPMVGGLIVAASGPGYAFFVASFGCLAVIAALALIRTGPVGGSPALVIRPLGNMAAVVRYVRERRGLAVAVAAAAVVGGLGLPVQTLMVVFAEDVFDRGAGGFGLMLMMVGLGATAVAPAVASMGGRVRRSQIQRVGMLLYGGVVVGLSVSPSFVVFLGLLALMGMAHLSSASSLNTTIQLQVDEGWRAQVLALYLMVLLAANPVGALTLGQLIEWIGPRPAFAVTGVLLLAAATVLHVSGWLSEMDAAPGTYSPEVAPEVHPTTPLPPRSESAGSATPAEGAPPTTPPPGRTPGDPKIVD